MTGRSLYSIGVFTLKVLYYAFVGTLTVLRGIFRLPARFRHARQLLSPALTCPSCQAVNTAYGRFTCGCGATSMSHVAAPCKFCHASCGWITCQDCGASIPLEQGR